MPGASQAERGSGRTEPGRRQSSQWAGRPRAVDDQSGRRGRSQNLDDLHVRSQQTFSVKSQMVTS